MVVGSINWLIDDSHSLDCNISSFDSLHLLPSHNGCCRFVRPGRFQARAVSDCQARAMSVCQTRAVLRPFTQSKDEF